MGWATGTGEMCAIHMQCTYMKDRWEGQAAVSCMKYSGFQHINDSTTAEIIPHSHYNLLGTLEMRPWKRGAARKPVRGVDDRGRVWAVGWVTSISELCAIYICNTRTWGIRFWGYYMVWPSGYVVGHGLGYKHQ